MSKGWIGNSDFGIDSVIRTSSLSLFSMDNDSPIPKRCSVVEPDKLPIIEPGHTFGSVSDKIGSFVLTHRTPKGWWVGFGIVVHRGDAVRPDAGQPVAARHGNLGVTNPVGWGFDIIELCLVDRDRPRRHVDLRDPACCCGRSGERRSTGLPKAMTLFAVACAGMYPAVAHRPTRGWHYWLFPYPNTMGIWPQFRSPLMWDVFAVSTYATVSLLFWFVRLDPRSWRRCATAAEADSPPIHLRHAGDGLARFGPALAPVRNAPTCCWPDLPRRWCFRCTRSSASTSRSASFPAGTRRSSRHTSWPGAIYCGLRDGADAGDSAPRRSTAWKTSSRCATWTTWPKIILVTGLIVAYGCMMEAFYRPGTAPTTYESFMILNRMKGPYAPIYWLLIACNVLAPQAFLVQEQCAPASRRCSLSR
mgnify:CR=1 FL=1